LNPFVGQRSIYHGEKPHPLIILISDWIKGARSCLLQNPLHTTLTKAAVRIVKKGRLGHEIHLTPNLSVANPLAFSDFAFKVY